MQNVQKLRLIFLTSRLPMKSHEKFFVFNKRIFIISCIAIARKIVIIEILFYWPNLKVIVLGLNFYCADVVAVVIFIYLRPTNRISFTFNFKL